MNYKEIKDIEIDGIDYRDAPEYSDSYISAATYRGKSLTEEELEVLNEDIDFVYYCIQNCT